MKFKSRYFNDAKEAGVEYLNYVQFQDQKKPGDLQHSKIISRYTIFDYSWSGT